jgi:type I site-specific restriction endonuclease
MAFHKTKDGVRDSRINALGRIKREDKPTNRELKDRYLVELLRKLRPLQAQSISQVSKILNNNEATDPNKLKAAAMLLTLYKELVQSAYGKDEEPDEESTEAIQETNRPAFSLVMLPVKAKE